MNSNIPQTVFTFWRIDSLIQSLSPNHWMLLKTFHRWIESPEHINDEKHESRVTTASLAGPNRWRPGLHSAVTPSGIHTLIIKFINSLAINERRINIAALEQLLLGWRSCGSLAIQCESALQCGRAMAELVVSLLLEMSAETRKSYIINIHIKWVYVWGAQRMWSEFGTARDGTNIRDGND